jgi:hypothetical protein
VFGTGRPTLNPQNQTGSWFFGILPYVEQDAAARLGTNPNGGQGAAIKIFMCPARGRQQPQPMFAADPSYPGITYSAVPAGLSPWCKTDYSANANILRRKLARTGPDVHLFRITDITDGTSNTFLAGEKSLDPRSYDSGSWNWDEPAFASGGGNSRSSARVLFDTIDTRPGPPMDGPFSGSWGSIHTAGVQFLLADGSVRTFSNSLHQSNTVRWMMTPASGEVIPEP